MKSIEIISRVFRDNNGRVYAIHCGEWPNITAYKRVDIDGERYFMLAAYGKHKLFRPNKQTRQMEYVRSI